MAGRGQEQAFPESDIASQLSQKALFGVPINPKLEPENGIHAAYPYKYNGSDQMRKSFQAGKRVEQHALQRNTGTFKGRRGCRNGLPVKYKTMRQSTVKSCIDSRKAQDQKHKLEVGEDSRLSQPRPPPRKTSTPLGSVYTVEPWGQTSPLQESSMSQLPLPPRISSQLGHTNRPSSATPYLNTGAASSLGEIDRTISKDNTGGEASRLASLMELFLPRNAGTQPSLRSSNHINPFNEILHDPYSRGVNLDDPLAMSQAAQMAQQRLFQQQQQARQGLMAQQAFNARMGVDGMSKGMLEGTKNPTNAAQIAAMRQGMRPQAHNPQAQAMLAHQIALQQQAAAQQNQLMEQGQLPGQPVLSSSRNIEAL